MTEILWDCEVSRRTAEYLGGRIEAAWAETAEACAKVGRVEAARLRAKTARRLAGLEETRARLVRDHARPVLRIPVLDAHPEPQR